MEFKTDVLLHGGDYNPDQWLDRPDILEKDVEMLAESGCNVVSLGIFAWSALEPEEGVFRLDWMEEVIDRLYAKGIRVILATVNDLLSGRLEPENFHGNRNGMALSNIRERLLIFFHGNASICMTCDGIYTSTVITIKNHF